MKKTVYKVEQLLENIGVVSIIVPVYNVARFLPNSLDSVVQQTYPYWEAVLVNDGSTDNSLEILQQYAARDSRFKVINKSNGGVASARNIGLDAITGQYVVFLDPDDMLYPQFLDIMLKTLQDSDMVWCKMRRCEENDTTDVCCRYSEYNTHQIDAFPISHFCRKRKPTLQISVCAKIYKKEALNEMRFETMFKVMAEDFYFSLRVFELLKKAIYISTPLMLYRKNSMSLTHRRISFETVDDHLLLLQCSVWHFKDTLDRSTRICFMRRLMRIVFRYVCTTPYLQSENFVAYWQKYSDKCRILQKQNVFCPQYLPLFHRFLCCLFLQRKWSALRLILHLYTKLHK